MQPLSTHYRYDSTKDDINPEVRQYLDEHFTKKLTNIDKSNPKLLVVFSGGNAVGKSTLAKRLSEEFGGLVIENDAVKRRVLEIQPELRENRDALSKLTWQYTMNLYPRLDSFTDNGLVIRDGVIDWYFDRILPVFEKAGYELFIVDFDISRAKAIELIHSRGDTPTMKEGRAYQLLNDHEIHTRRFREHYTPNVTLDDATVFDHDLVAEELRKFLLTLAAKEGLA